MKANDPTPESQATLYYAFARGEKAKAQGSREKRRTKKKTKDKSRKERQWA